MADHLLPPNATAEEKAIASALSRLSAVPVPIRDLWNPDTCPADLLPWLAWALSVDVWDAAWPEAKKRNVIKAAIEVHRYKGTPYAVETALEAMDLLAKVKEWPQYGGDPYKFKVEVDVIDAGLTEESVALIRTAVDKTKNARSHLDSIDIYLSVTATADTAKATQIGCSLDIYPWEPETIDLQPGSGLNAAVAAYNITEIGVIQ